MSFRFGSVLLLVLWSLAACREPAALRQSDAHASMSGEPAAASPAGAYRPVATIGPDDARPHGSDPAGHARRAASAPPAADCSAFAAGSIPDSRATLPPFPLFAPPAGLRSAVTDRDKTQAFDREHMVAGEAVVAVEGKVFRDRYRLAGARRGYGEAEFHRSYRDAVHALGGVEVSRGQSSVATGGTCAGPGCERHTYLIRQGGEEYWVQVSSGGSPLLGHVTVLERAAMACPLELLSAG